MSKIYSFTVLALAISMLTGCSLYAPQPPATPAPWNTYSTGPAPLKPIEASTPAQPESTTAKAEPASTPAPPPTSLSTTPAPINTVEELPILSTPLQGITYQKGGLSFEVKEMLYDQNGLSFRVEVLNNSASTQYLHYRQGKRGEFDELPLLMDQSGQEYYILNIDEEDTLAIQRGTKYDAVWNFGPLFPDTYAVKMGINLRSWLPFWMPDDEEPSFTTPRIVVRANAEREEGTAEVGIAQQRYCLTVTLQKATVDKAGIALHIEATNEEGSGVIYDLFKKGKPKLTDARGFTYFLDRWDYEDCKSVWKGDMQYINEGEEHECLLHFYPAPEAGTKLALTFFPTEDFEELEPMAFQFTAP